MVLNNANKNNSISLEVLASVFTVSSNFPDNPRISLNLHSLLRMNVNAMLDFIGMTIADLLGRAASETFN